MRYEIMSKIIMMTITVIIFAVSGFEAAVIYGICMLMLLQPKNT